MNQYKEGPYTVGSRKGALGTYYTVLTADYTVSMVFYFKLLDSYESRIPPPQLPA